MIVDNQSDPAFSDRLRDVAMATTFGLEANSAKLAYPHSFGTLIFRHLLNDFDRNSDLERLLHSI